MLGGEGDDVIAPGLGTNFVDGGNGIDTVIYNGEVVMERGIHVDLKRRLCVYEQNAEDTLHSIENAYGTEYDDMLQGDDEDRCRCAFG